MTKRSEFLPERDPLLDRYEHLAKIAAIAVRQECEFCSNKNNMPDACAGCITDVLKEALESVGAYRQRTETRKKKTGKK